MFVVTYYFCRINDDRHFPSSCQSIEFCQLHSTSIDLLILLNLLLWTLTTFLMLLMQLLVAPFSSWSVLRACWRWICLWLVLNTFFVSTFLLDVFVEWRYLVENTSAKWISWDFLRNIFLVSVKIDSRWFEWALIYLVLLLILLNGLYILKFNLKVMSK